MKLNKQINILIQLINTDIKYLMFILKLENHGDLDNLKSSLGATLWLFRHTMIEIDCKNYLTHFHNNDIIQPLMLLKNKQSKEVELAKTNIKQHFTELFNLVGDDIYVLFEQQ